MSQNGRLASPKGETRRPSAYSEAERERLQELRGKRSRLDFLAAALMGAEEVAKWHGDEPTVRHAISAAVAEVLSARLRTTIEIQTCRRSDQPPKPTSAA